MADPQIDIGEYSESESIAAETSSTEKATKEKFDAFMGVLARDEDLKPLDPSDLISQLRIEGVISDGDCEKIEAINNKDSRKVVRLSSNILNSNATRSPSTCDVRS